MIHNPDTASTSTQAAQSTQEKALQAQELREKLSEGWGGQYPPCLDGDAVFMTLEELKAWRKGHETGE